ncbi:hypothetical protein TRVA0_028S00694 [Trichomonascus vanleenenianus]|uniref:uncharacterized protein n=1 Tax=Trichomonascus vanleenenianus TaxID=2268995 RepID=UPI003ECB879F
MSKTDLYKKSILEISQSEPEDRIIFVGKVSSLNKAGTFTHIQVCDASGGNVAVSINTTGDFDRRPFPSEVQPGGMILFVRFKGCRVLGLTSSKISFLFYQDKPGGNYIPYARFDSIRNPSSAQAQMLASSWVQSEKHATSSGIGSGSVQELRHIIMNNPSPKALFSIVVSVEQVNGVEQMKKGHYRRIKVTDYSMHTPIYITVYDGMALLPIWDRAKKLVVFIKEVSFTNSGEWYGKVRESNSQIIELAEENYQNEYKKIHAKINRDTPDLAPLPAETSEDYEPPRKRVHKEHSPAESMNSAEEDSGTGIQYSAITIPALYSGYVIDYYPKTFRAWFNSDTGLQFQLQLRGPHGFEYWMSFTHKVAQLLLEIDDVDSVTPKDLEIKVTQMIDDKDEISVYGRAKLSSASNGSCVYEACVP